MKFITATLNKIFDSHARLGIMSLLMIEEWIDFKTLKEKLELSDGNLASHIKKLEAVEFVYFKKEFVGRKPQTSYSATAKGRKAFNDYLDAIEQLLKQREKK